MSVNLSKSAWHYKLQKFTFSQDPERSDFCSYFWNTVFAGVFAPMAFCGYVAKQFLGIQHGYAFRESSNNLEAGFAITFGAFIGLTVIVMIALVAFLWLTVLLTPTGAGVITGCGIFGLLAFFFYKTWDFWYTYFIAVKNRLCPLITWKE